MFSLHITTRPSTSVRRNNLRTFVLAVTFLCMVIVGGVLLTTHTALAQPYPVCFDPYCPDPPLGAQTTMDYQLPAPCGSCSVRVAFRHRYACGSCDVNIVGITVLTPGCTCTYSDILPLSFASLIADLMNVVDVRCKPVYPETPCTFALRVMAGGCWRAEVSPEMLPTYYSCNTQCCYAGYQVCIDGSGTVTYTLVDPPEVQEQCTSPCFEACGYFPPEVIHQPQTKISIRGNKDQNSVQGITAAVSPNPTTGATTIMCSGIDEGEVQLVIVDVHGIVVKTQSAVVNGAHVAFVIDAGVLPIGAYTYRIQDKSEQLCEGKISIVR